MVSQESLQARCFVTFKIVFDVCFADLSFWSSWKSCVGLQMTMCVSSFWLACFELVRPSNSLSGTHAAADPEIGIFSSNSCWHIPPYPHSYRHGGVLSAKLLRLQRMVPLLVSALFLPSQTAAAPTGIRLSFGLQWCCIREEQNLIPWVTFVVPVRTRYPFGYLRHILFKNQAISVQQCWWHLKWQRWKTWHFPDWMAQYGGVGRYLCVVVVSFWVKVTFVMGVLKEGFLLLMLPLIPSASEQVNKFCVLIQILLRFIF